MSRHKRQPRASALADQSWEMRTATLGNTDARGRKRSQWSLGIDLSNARVFRDRPARLAAISGKRVDRNSCDRAPPSGEAITCPMHSLTELWFGRRHDIRRDTHMQFSPMMGLCPNF